jgi:hypothetical protein
MSTWQPAPTSIAFYRTGQLPECFLMSRLCTDARENPEFVKRVRDAFLPPLTAQSAAQGDTMWVNTEAISGARACPSQRARPTAVIQQRDAERIVLY